jgi:hydrogenase maturation protein HypF
LNICGDLSRNEAKGKIAMKFHVSVSEMVRCMCCLVRDKTGIKQVALSGGVFQNRLLARKIESELFTEGFEVLIHRQVPCNDGGISLGQAVIANFSGD